MREKLIELINDFNEFEIIVWNCQQSILLGLIDTSFDPKLNLEQHFLRLGDLSCRDIIEKMSIGQVDAAIWQIELKPKK